MNHHPRMNNSTHQIAQDDPINPGFGGPITVGGPLSIKDTPFYKTCKYPFGTNWTGNVTVVFENIRRCKDGQCPKFVYDQSKNRGYFEYNPNDPCYNPNIKPSYFTDGLGKQF
jgi:hypothetical protein